MRRKEKCPYKPPRPPRELCRTFADWLLGIVSPSRLFFHACSIDPPERVKEYFYRSEEWKLNMLRWKVQQRTATKEEYKKLNRAERKQKNVKS